MLKLLLCLFCGAATAILTLQLRQQHLNLEFQANKLHNEIESNQSEMWNQQLSIAISAFPSAIAAAIKQQDLKLTPPIQEKGVRSWIEDPDAGK